VLQNDLLAGAVLIIYYIVGLVPIPLMLKAWSKVPHEVIRKLQHVAYSLSVFILLRLFSTWYMAVAGAFLLVVLAYPALYLLEKTAPVSYTHLTLPPKRIV